MIIAAVLLSIAFLATVLGVIELIAQHRALTVSCATARQAAGERIAHETRTRHTLQMARLGMAV